MAKTRRTAGKGTPRVLRSRIVQEKRSKLGGRDPIKRIRKTLIAGGTIGEKEASKIEEHGRQTIGEALEYAKIIPAPAVDTILGGYA